MFIFCSYWITQINKAYAFCPELRYFSQIMLQTGYFFHFTKNEISPFSGWRTFKKRVPLTRFDYFGKFIPFKA